MTGGPVPAATCPHPFVPNPPGQFGHVLARPWVEVLARHGGSVHRVWCLVDTGADDTLLDLGTAAVLGINLFGPKAPISTPAGVANFVLEPAVDLVFAGTTAVADVLFGPVAVPLLGRSALLAVPGGVTATFSTAQWLHS